MKLRLLSLALELAADMDAPEWLFIAIERRFWAELLEQRRTSL